MSVVAMTAGALAAIDTHSSRTVTSASFVRCCIVVDTRTGYFLVLFHSL